MAGNPLDRIFQDDRAQRAAAELLVLASGPPNPAEFLQQALPRVVAASGGSGAGLAVLNSEGCRWIGQSGSVGQEGRKLPQPLVSEVLDREETLQRGDWMVAPLTDRVTPGEVLAVYGAGSLPRVDALAAALGAALVAVREREATLRRVQRLETILHIAQQWNRTNEMEPLLVQMAEASTKMLSADRASIFLWDKENKTLVARPALGVEGGQLRIPDSAGVVGDVIHTGRPRRIDAQLEQDQIDRQVDKRLGYHTRTLLCVPLLSSRGEVLGAFEVLNRHQGNFTDEDEAALVELAAHAAIALENTQQWEQLLTSHRQLVEQAAEGIQLVGNSPAIGALRSTIERVAGTELAILILGENGTGKEVVSRSIHYLSRRRNEPFIAVNCAALTETLLESELFGHEKGAFTDAHEARPGKFELASGGTLFLDEIGDLSPGGQSKLLRVLEEKIVVRVGGSRPIHTDARVLAATNQDLAEMVRHRKFREDLYYRLNVVTLELPPLRERGNDIMLLAEHFLSQFCRDARRMMPKFVPSARTRLLGHSWPGNVRELRNLMERLAYLVPGERIEAEDLAFILSPRRDGLAAIDLKEELTEATRQFQIEYIKRAIEAAGGNMSDAAAQLGLHRSNLYRKMRQLEMPVRE